MASFSRRNFALRASSSVLCGLTSRAFASGTSNALNTTGGEARLPYSNDYDAFSVARLHSLMASSGASPHGSYALKVANAIRPHARQIANTDFESQFQRQIAVMTPSQFASAPSPSDIFVQYLATFTPALSASNYVLPPELSSDDIAAGLERLRTNGLSGTIQKVADVLAYQSTLPQATTATYSLQDHVEHVRAGHAHLHEACFFCTKAQFCSDLLAAINDTALLALIFTIVCGIGIFATGGAGAAFCAAVIGDGVGAAIAIAAAMALYASFCGTPGLGLTPS